MVDELQCPRFLFFSTPSPPLFFSSLSAPNVPPLHLLVRWKIGETLFSPFPITQNRPGLLKWPRLHLPIGTEPRISPWKKNVNLLFSSFISKLNDFCQLECVEHVAVTSCCISRRTVKTWFTLYQSQHQQTLQRKLVMKPPDTNDIINKNMFVSIFTHNIYYWS